MADWLSKEFIGALGHLVDDVSCLQHVATAKVVDAAVGTTRNRPHPWSTCKPYTSWQGLTDRTYLARHLPEAEPPADLPNEAEVAELFRRPVGDVSLSETSSCLFPAFAQYLTDGFIRTVLGKVDRTTSNHEIDLCPLYGRTPDQTWALRLRDPARPGRLRSRIVRTASGDEEFAPGLYDESGSDILPEYAGLDIPLFVKDLAPEQRKTLFAFGGDRANSTMFTSMMNTLLLREHNRMAGEIQEDHPDWDDDRVFETARNVMIPLFINIVIEEYINHIAPLPFRLVADPSVAWTAEWNRPNWMTVEFSLLYRWHSLMPEEIRWSQDHVIPMGEFRQNNKPLTDGGLQAAFIAASANRAANLGPFNTADKLMILEQLAVQQGRINKLDTYNNYRIAFGRVPAGTFADISSRDDVRTLLEQLYTTVDRVEFYAGLFAEDRVPGSALPDLILRMVAVDAFSQALTNPLLSQHVFNPATFTEAGWHTIQTTHCLADLVARNVPGNTDKTRISMSIPDPGRGTCDAP